MVVDVMIEFLLRVTAAAIARVWYFGLDAWKFFLRHRKVILTLSPVALALVVAVRDWALRHMPRPPADVAHIEPLDRARNWGAPSFGNNKILCLDPASTFCATSSDQNDCSCGCGGAGTGVGPCLHAFELANRWFGWEPMFNQSVTLNIKSSQANADDPFPFRPYLAPQQPDGNNGVSVIINCSPASGTASTITALTAKNTGTNTALAATFVGSAQKILVVNTTQANSVAYVARSSGTNMTQPMSPITPGANGFPPGAITENNSWTNGDTLSLITPNKVYFTEIVPHLMGLNDTGNVQVYRCLIPELSPTVQPGDDRISIGRGVVLEESILERNLFIRPEQPGYQDNYAVLNTVTLGGATGGPAVQNPATGTPSVPFHIQAGELSAVNGTGTGQISLQNVWVSDATVIRSTAVGNNGFFNGYSYFSEVQIDLTTTVKAVAGGVIDCHGATGVPIGLVWGLGTLDSSFGTIAYSSANTAPTTFPVNAIKINGATTACCATVAGPSTVNCGLSLTAATLNAGACSTVGPALGNNAFNFGVGSFVGF